MSQDKLYNPIGLYQKLFTKKQRDLRSVVRIPWNFFFSNRCRECMISLQRIKVNLSIYKFNKLRQNAQYDGQP